MSFKVEYKGKVADIYRCSELVNSEQKSFFRETEESKNLRKMMKE